MINRCVFNRFSLGHNLLRKCNRTIELLRHANEYLFRVMYKPMIDQLTVHLSYLLKHEILIEE